MQLAPGILRNGGSEAITVLHAPMEAWVSPLDEVPDAVFADRMLGDGVALDPLEGVVRAPCDGVVVAIAPTCHSVTVRSGIGAEILIHVGIDTVALDGNGFEAVIAAGAEVRKGDVLLRFDIDAVAQKARSLVTPMIVVNEGFSIFPLVKGQVVAAGESLLEVRSQGDAAAARADTAGAVVERTITVPLSNGFHARPAARIGAALKIFVSDVSIATNGRSANARSVTSLLSLNVRHGDEIVISGRGPDSLEAVDLLYDLIASGMGEAGPPPLPAIAIPPDEQAETSDTGAIQAVRAAPGGALGIAFRLHVADRPVPERGAAIEQEMATLDSALTTLSKHLGHEAVDSIEAAHLAILNDPELIEGARERILLGASAASAWRDVMRTREMLIASTGNAMLIERAADLRDVERRLIDLLLGEEPAKAVSLPERAILVSDDLLPSIFLGLDHERLAGIVTAMGGPTSHVALLAAARGIPMLVSAGTAVLAIADGTPLLVEEREAVLRVDPDQAQKAAWEDRRRMNMARARDESALAHEPCALADGTRIDVFANCGSSAEALVAVAAGAEGCGLLRTEFLFLDRQTAPSEDEQAVAYADVARALAGRPLIVRTLDAGSDKPLSYLPSPREDNPALGARGIRLSLANLPMLAEQYRAILRGVPDHQRRIMLPMITDLTEYRQARDLLRQTEAVMGIGHPTPLGIMVETPAAALLAGQLAGEADFLSIGSNDLTQYALAADRGNAALATYADALHPAVLRLIALSADGARASGRWLGICGSIASDPDAAAILIGLGVDELSVTPSGVPSLKARIRRLDLIRCRALARVALEQPDARAVRQLIKDDTTCA